MLADPEAPRAAMLSGQATEDKSPYASTDIMPRGSFYSSDALKLSVNDAGADESDYTPAQRRIGWRCAFFLNLCVLWCYQSLLAAQDYYSRFFPKADLSFMGTASAGSAMVVGQLLSMAGFGERFGFDGRILFAYCGFAVISVLVIVPHLATPALLISAFGVVGFLNSLSESPLYDLGAIWGESGRLVGALNLANGSAGLLNILLSIVIRLVCNALVSAAGAAGEAGSGGAEAASGGGGERTDPAEEASTFAHTAFNAATIVMVVACLPTYLLWTRRVPVFAARLAAQSQRRAAAPALRQQLGVYARVGKTVGVAAAAEVLIFFASLLVWPGLPLGAPLDGSWFARHERGWVFSSLVILSFNASDFLGRWLATVGPLYTSLGSTRARLGAAAVLRCALAPAVWALSSPQVSLGGDARAWLILAVLFVVGLTNGLWGTLCMIWAQRNVVEAERECASKLLVLALYLGIALGSVVAAVLAKLDLF